MTWTSIHNKRVTLNLARHSAAAREIPGLVEAIDRLATNEWDMYKLAQEDVERIYTAFDDAMEQRVKAEFEADPNFLIDHGHTYSSCELCGQYPIRFEFRINPVAGGQSVNCGIDCIVNHQLHVKGVETAEAAKRVLEAAIRKQLRKVRIEAWHKATGFHRQHFGEVLESLWKCRNTYPRFSDYGSNEEYQAALVADRTVGRETRYLLHEVKLLERFYVRNGWLGTEKKWDTWVRAVKFVRQHSDCKLPLPIGFAQAMGKLPSEALKDAMTEVSSGDAEADSPSEAADRGPSTIGKAESLGSAAIIAAEPFAAVTQQLVFGGK